MLKTVANRSPWLIRNIGWMLALMLMFKILGYFTLSENVAITRVLKIILRVGMTGAVFLTYQSLLAKNFIPSFRYDNVLSPLLYIGYLMLGLASMMWSTDPGYSLLQWVMTVESMIFVYFYLKTVDLVNHFYPEKIKLSMQLTVAIFIILAGLLIGLIIAPDVFFRSMRGGEEQRFGGYLMNPNELGMLASIGAATGYLAVAQSKKRFWPIFMVIIAIVALLLTSSRSSMIGFFLVTVLVIQSYGSAKIKAFVYFAIIASIPLVLNIIIFKAGDVEEVLSMTGRIPFWKALLNEGIVQEPFFGFGFMRIYYTDAFQSANTYAGKMTHNTFMQVLMNLGFVGLGIVMAQLFITVGAMLKTKIKADKMVLIALFIPLLINSFTEFGIFGETNYAILFYQIMILKVTISYESRYSVLQNIKLKMLQKSIAG